MLVIEIRDILKQEKDISIHELVNQIKVDVTIVREILNFWIKKGMVKKISSGSACCGDGKGCQGVCSFLALEIYSWVK
jgi:ribosomal protein S25